VTLLVKDANTTTQSISTQADVAGNLVPVHAPAAISGGIAMPVGPTAPLPVINAAGGAATDGSGTVVIGGGRRICLPGLFRSTVTSSQITLRRSFTFPMSVQQAPVALRSRYNQARYSQRPRATGRRALSASMAV
jgi:hypothetical protein